MDKQSVKRFTHQLSPASLSFLDKVSGGERAFQAWCDAQALSVGPLVKLFDSLVTRLGPLYVRLGDNHQVELLFDEHPIKALEALRTLKPYFSVPGLHTSEGSLTQFRHRATTYHCLKLSLETLGELLGCFVNDVMVFDLEDMFQLLLGPRGNFIQLALTMYDKQAGSTSRSSPRSSEGLTPLQTEVFF